MGGAGRGVGGAVARAPLQLPMGGGGGRGARAGGRATPRGADATHFNLRPKERAAAARVSDGSWVAGARTPGPVRSRGRHPRPAPGGPGEKSERGAGRLCLQVRAEVRSRLEPQLARGAGGAAREPAGQRRPLPAPESALREACGQGGLGLRRGLSASWEEG